MYCLIDRSERDQSGSVNKYDKRYSALLNVAKQCISKHSIRLNKTVTYWDSDGNVERILIYPNTWERPFFEIIRVDKVQQF